MLLTGTALPAYRSGIKAGDGAPWLQIPVPTTSRLLASNNRRRLFGQGTASRGRSFHPPHAMPA